MFVLSHCDLTNRGTYGGVLKKLLEKRGAPAWFHNIWTHEERNIDFQAIYGMKNHITYDNEYCAWYCQNALGEEESSGLDS